MSYPQDPQGWQPPDAGGGPQQPGGANPPAQNPQAQPGGGYNPGGGYGDPYAQPAYDPTSGVPQYQQPDPYQPPDQYPTSGQPQYPADQYPTSGQPGSAPPTGPLPPGSYGQPGYGQQSYGQPSYGQPSYPATGYPGGPSGPVPVPPKKSRTGLILGLVAAFVVVVCLIGGVGGFFLLRDDDDPEPDPTAQPTTPSPVTTSASPTADPPLLSTFVDPQLRDFARNGAAKASNCRVVTSKLSNNVSEGVSCDFPGSFTVLYVRYKTLEDRDSYAQSARNGFRGDPLIVDGDSFWADDQGTRQGNYITGARKDTSARFTYWDKVGVPVSGEVSTSSTSATTVETFWKSIR